MLTDTEVKIENQDELEHATSTLYLAATLFFLTLRRAHFHEQPALAEAVSAQIREGQPALRLEMGMLPSLEAGVVQGGEFMPFFKWTAPVDTATVN